MPAPRDPKTGAPAEVARGTPSRRRPFEYAIVRVVPRVERGERFNAGVIVHSRPHRFLGARVWLPARPGWTPQWLERTLRCHEATSAMQPGVAAAADPFWLPDSWVDIEVVSDRAAFVAVLRVNRVDEGRQVYSRAQDFVAKPASER